MVKEILVDPSVYDVAEDFVDDKLSEVTRKPSEAERKAMVIRVAGAAQQAIEDELDAIGDELLQRDLDREAAARDAHDQRQLDELRGK